MSPQQRVNHTPFWRWLTSLVLVGLLSGLAPMPLARAAPAGTGSVGVWLQAEQVGAQRTLCVDDVVQIRLRVIKRIGVEGEFALRQLVGVNVQAAVVGSGGVGSVSPASSATRLSSHPPGVAYFSFKAEKPGTVIVSFRASVVQATFLGIPVSGGTVGTQLVFQVEDCKYRVSLLSRWRVPGEAQLTLLAKVQIAGMVEDGGGHYRGTARVQWAANAGVVGDCQGMLLPDSQAEVTGQVYGPDEFIVDVDYGTSNTPLTIDCRGTGGTVPYALTPAPLTFSVTAEGGRLTLEQVLRGPEDTPGTVIVIVKRAQGQ
jgi:hypothetical protein